MSGTDVKTGSQVAGLPRSLSGNREGTRVDSLVPAIPHKTNAEKIVTTSAHPKFGALEAAMRVMSQMKTQNGAATGRGLELKAAKFSHEIQ